MASAAVGTNPRWRMEIMTNWYQNPWPRTADMHGILPSLGPQFAQQPPQEPLTPQPPVFNPASGEMEDAPQQQVQGPQPQAGGGGMMSGFAETLRQAAQNNPAQYYSILAHLAAGAGPQQFSQLTQQHQQQQMYEEQQDWQRGYQEDVLRERRESGEAERNYKMWDDARTRFDKEQQEVLKAIEEGGDYYDRYLEDRLGGDPSKFTYSTLPDFLRYRNVETKFGEDYEAVREYMEDLQKGEGQVLRPKGFENVAKRFKGLEEAETSLREFGDARLQDALEEERLQLEKLRTDLKVARHNLSSKAGDLTEQQQRKVALLEKRYDTAAKTVAAAKKALYNPDAAVTDWLKDNANVPWGQGLPDYNQVLKDAQAELTAAKQALDDWAAENLGVTDLWAGTDFDAKNIRSEIEKRRLDTILQTAQGK